MTIEGETRSARAAVRRPRDAEPDRVRGDVSAAGGAVDRFLLRIGVGYPTREHEWEMLDRRLERAEDEVDLSGGRRSRDARRDAARRRAGLRGGVARLLHRRPRRGHPNRARGAGRREPARLARAPQARSAAGRPSTAGTSRLRTTSRPLPFRRSRIASRSGRSSGSSAVARTTTSCARCSSGCRRRRWSRLSARSAAQRGPVEGVAGNREVPPATDGEALGHREAQGLRRACGHRADPRRWPSVARSWRRSLRRSPCSPALGLALARAAAL